MMRRQAIAQRLTTSSNKSYISQLNHYMCYLLYGHVCTNFVHDYQANQE